MNADRMIEWIRTFFKENSNDANAVIGISGGKDSTVAAALCAKALGPDKVYGVIMPNGIQSDLDDAVTVAIKLGIHFTIFNINSMYIDCIDMMKFTIFDNLKKQQVDIPEISDKTKINLPPRLRMAVLYAFAQSLNGRVVNTCNLSEEFIGYSTRWGDSVGDFAPFAQLTTDEVIALGDELNLPYELVHKTPSDGLCGLTDEYRFGFTYRQLNDYIRKGTSGDAAIDEKIEDKHKKNLFKQNPIPSFNINE